MSGLESFSNDIDDNLCIFMKLLIFFNAADTVTLSETPSNLQYALNECFVYCETWKLHVNVKKKISYFRKDQLLNIHLNSMTRIKK